MPRNRRTAPPAPREEPAQPDALDLALLAALRDDGRLTVQSLAARVGLAPATTSVRVQRLFRRGLLTGVHARIDHGQLGYGVCAYVLLQVNAITGERGSVSRRLLSFPEVEEVAWVTGDHDVLVKVWARDTSHLEAVVISLDELGARSHTLIVLGRQHLKAGVEFERPPTALPFSGEGSL